MSQDPNSIRPLIVTHHAPDLDAVTAVWLLKRFDAQRFADARVAFVNPGDQISQTQLLQLGYTTDSVTHVDTGLGQFDHHQPERGQLKISAASLVFDHLTQVHPELTQDQALKTIVDYTVEIDHFGEVNWPEPDHVRYNFMIHDLLRGVEFTDPHNDDSQLQFGFQCLDGAYAGLTQHWKAIEIIKEKGQQFSINHWRCLALETRNDDTIKLAQKQGFDLVIRKDPKQGHIRIKARPDSPIELSPLHNKIKEQDEKGTWYYHPSGKMLINGSRKHRNQTPSPLSIQDVINLLKETYD